MQAMLSSFSGLQIDWRRGHVIFVGGGTSSRVTLPPCFWSDFSWWEDQLPSRYSLRWEERLAPVATLVATDASDWGSGQLAWLDGGREESQLRFTRAESRRPIKWRELSGILRAVQLFARRNDRPPHPNVRVWRY